MKTITSAGGPLLCVEQSMVENWHGVQGSGKEQSDYARACAIRDYLGKVAVGACDALVLGDMPLETSIWQPPGALPRIVRVYYADRGVNVHELLESQNDLDFDNPAEVLSFNFSSSPLVIFDSACPGSESSLERLSFNLSPGKYLVMTKQFQPDERTSVLVHMFAPFQ